MTNLSAKILKNEYQIEDDKIKFIPHGTHLIKPLALNLRETVPLKGKLLLLLLA
jgi:hypothetical protein